MKTTIKSILAGTLLLWASNFVQAQQEMPQQLTDILRLEGSWEGKAALTLEGKSYSFVYRAKFNKTAGGNGLYMDEWFDAPDLGKLMGANLIGFNANDGNVHWFSVDNFGTTHDHLGTWKDGQHFYMEANEMMDNKKFIEKIDMVFRSADTMDLVLVASIDGNEFEKLNIQFKRQPKSGD